MWTLRCFRKRSGYFQVTDCESARVCSRVWATAYNIVAFPLAAGVLYPILLRHEIAALAMSGSTVLVALNALLLKRFRGSDAWLNYTSRT